MKHQEIRQKFLDFFKARGHAVVPSSPLLPDDPSVLFTTAGMQQFKPYYIDPSLAPAKSVISIQKCVRTGDIDEVGDERHLTFFEMLGNFSFGGYFKKEAIEYAYDFVTKEMGLTIDYVTVLDTPSLGKDEESYKIWKELGLSENQIKYCGIDDNFWGPTGSEGPCGPTTEIYVDGIEIWNVVFNQYFSKKSREQSLKEGWELKDLDKPGIDTGMGLERLALVSQFPGKAGEITVFETDLFMPIMALMPESFDTRTKRIMADHARSIVFMVSDGVRPSNKDQGYVLRRLMRRMVARQAFGQSGLMSVGLGNGVDLEGLLVKVVDEYRSFYPNLEKDIILPIFSEEAKKYGKAIAQGIKEIAKLESIDAEQAFRLFESFGLPYEAIKDIGVTKTKSLTREGFDAKFKEHQEKSRAGAEKKFGGHGLLLDTGELKAADETELKIVTRLHTATHLLQAALRKVLGDGVSQAGSDITAERLRFDFTFPRKMTDEEIRQTENLVNEVISRDLSVTKQTLPQEEALKTGALHFFKIKYPPQVDVYTIEGFSKEFCGGPHVTHTGEIGSLKITKEEGVSAGVRRIRATVS